MSKSLGFLLSILCLRVLGSSEGSTTTGFSSLSGLVVRGNPNSSTMLDFNIRLTLELPLFETFKAFFFRSFQTLIVINRSFTSILHVFHNLSTILSEKA